jgi:hypothetical protein
MDVQAFLDAMEESVIEPLRATRALFVENSHVTRLYTTMSAEEMIIDPEFDLNPDLGDVSNVHIATRVMECNGNDWTIQLPGGIELTGNGSTWPVPLEDTEMPFNVRILQLSTSGEGDVLLDNTDLVLSRLSDLGLSDVVPEFDPDPGPGGPGSDPDEPGGPGGVNIGDPDEVDESDPDEYRASPVD